MREPTQISLLAALAFPDRDAASPVPVAADCPVPRTFEPVAEPLLTDGLRHPVDVLVDRDHTIPERLDIDEPGGNRLVDQRGAGAPAKWVGMSDLLVTDDQLSVLENPDESGVGFLDVLSCDFGDFIGEACFGVDRVDHDVDAGIIQRKEVGLAVCGRHVHQAGAFIDGDVCRSR